MVSAADAEWVGLQTSLVLRLQGPPYRRALPDDGELNEGDDNLLCCCTVKVGH